MGNNKKRVTFNAEFLGIGGSSMVLKKEGIIRIINLEKMYEDLYKSCLVKIREHYYGN